MINELHEKLINNEVTSAELIKESLSKCHETNERYNTFVTILDDAKEKDITDNLLSGIPYGLKDNFSTKGILTTGSSNTLKDYVPVFNATVVEKLNNCNAVLVGKTVLDEFGMGGTGTTGHTGIVKNPWDERRMCAGSSCGSAASVSNGDYLYALGSDTGDSVRKPAAYCGIVGYKPTYGMISRFGLFPFASSLDTVGVLTRSVMDAAIVVDNIKGKDEKDMTTWDSSNIQLAKNITRNISNKKLFYIKEILEVETDNKEVKEHLKNFYDTLKLLEKDGYQINEVSIDKTLLNAIPATYTTISSAEATSNMSNLTGILYGPRSNKDNVVEMIKDYRTNNFSSLIKRRFIIGSYVLQKENQERYFKNACRVRRLIVDKMKELFNEYDGLIMPVGSGPAPFLEGIKDKSVSEETILLDEHLIIANFGGFPSISIPNGFISNMPVGINITGNVYEDEKVLSIAYDLESKMNYKGMISEVNDEI